MQGALKPVSPKEDPIEREGLSQNGETAERQEELEMGDESSQEEDEVQEGRASKGQQSEPIVENVTSFVLFQFCT